MQQIENNPTQGLGIASLILGILSMILGIIPCTFFLGITLSVIGIILGAVGISKANRLRVDKGLLIAGLVTSIIGFGISSLWGLAFKQVFNVPDIEKYEEYYDANDNSGTDNTVDFDTLIKENDKTMDELEEYMDEIETKDAKPDDK